MLAALGLVSVLFLWELSSRVGWLNPALVPAPSRLPKVFLDEIAEGSWLQMLGCSLRHYTLGVGVGTIAGIAAGVLIGVFPRIRALQSWIAAVLRPVPPLAWIPFAIIWFGVSTQAAAFMIAIGVFWINYFATWSAVMMVGREYFELAQIYGHRTFWPQLSKIILPGAAPGILSGIRSGLGQGWMLVVAAELFGVPGMGQRMLAASGLLATDVVLVYMMTIAAVYALTDWVYVRFENRVLQWQFES